MNGEHHIEIEKRLARPVHADVAEEAVFYRVPFGARRRIMTQDDRQPEGATQLVLQVLFSRSEDCIRCHHLHRQESAPGRREDMPTGHKASINLLNS
jgi:hypothetical protein